MLGSCVRTAEFPCRHIPADPGAARLLGLYPQRQDGLWMQRVKVLGGALTAEQWRALARIAAQFSPGTPLHLTTRQDVEIHDLAPDRVPAVQHGLADAGLTSVGACGDTLRNLTVCPCSGLKGGAVDLLPLARQIRRTLEAEPDIYSLPRKFKIALSCGEQCGQPWINDLGLVARKHDGRWGFLVTTGGSLGAKPGTAMKLFDWLPAADALPLAVAAVGLFAAHGDREHRTRARLRHIRERVGNDKFAKMLAQKFEEVRQQHPWPELTLQESSRRFDELLKLTFPNGDVTPEAAEALGDLAEREDLRVRLAIGHQVMLFARDRGSLIKAVGEEPPLTAPAKPQPGVVACPGTRWCARALVDTNQIADRIRAELGDRLTDATCVCISGCPNGCTHSAVANIGLKGRTIRRNNEKLEAYDLYAGGGMGRDDRLAELKAAKLSADEALAAISKLL